MVAKQNYFRQHRGEKTFT